MGRHGPEAAGRRAGVRRGGGRAGAGVRRAGRVLAARRAAIRRTGGGHRPHPAGAGRNAVGAHGVVAVLRCGTRCGDRAFDGGGDRRGGGRRAEPGRRTESDRHPVPADVAAVRAGRDGAAGVGCGRRREIDRRLRRPHCGGVRLAGSDGDRRTARAGRCGDRGGRRSGPVGAPRRGGRGVASSDH